MHSVRMLMLVALLASACSSAPTTAAPQEANELIFAGERPTPTLVPAADSVSTDELPPSLAFADWTIDDLVDRLDSALDRPATITFAGTENGDETLFLAGNEWAAVGSPTEPDGPMFITRGQGDDAWVTYEHVRAGVLSHQAFSASANGIDLDQLLSTPTATNDTVSLQLLADRALLDETADLESMWVVYDRNSRGFFASSVLTPELVDEILTDAVRTVIAADSQGTTEIVASDGEYRIAMPDSNYPAVDVADNGTINISSSAGWSLEIADGVDGEVLALGQPEDRDILTRELLLTASAAPSVCIADDIEATELVENGLVVCDDLDQLREISAGVPRVGDESETE